MNREELLELKNELMPNATITVDNFIIVSGWSEVKAIEEATEMCMDEIAQIIAEAESKYDRCWGFEDEYDYCTECFKSLRTSPDSYMWLPDWSIVNECERWCSDCIKQNPDVYLQEIINNPRNSNVIFSDSELEDLGFTKLEEKYESGLHEHQTDDPQKILDKLLKEGYEEIIFNITSKGQFDTNYECWYRNPYSDEFKEELESLRDGNDLKDHVIDYLLDYASNADDIKSHMKDILHYGCVSGTVGHLIYYHDTYKFFDEYYEEIEELRQEYEEELGESLKIENDLKNTLAWFGFEETVRRVADELQLNY